ncbi:hypothetical protein DFH07DRAFT_961924 [Mycena maculata]|uniref:Uncharacterized protein n=1 Tax=Mycena maculata TaxID=230809 RepID=A0AAD7ITZ0_9AGAR|nr:hypothetical protein DFH07DRAFT_961924 [Mycena maculata]
MRLCCPRLGIQAFVRALCDIHGIAPRPWLGAQFSVAFDVYLAILARVDRRVKVALGRDAPNWRLRNACTACLYKVEGEPHLKFAFIGTIDGNNSLSRFFLHEREESLADGTSAPGALRELHNNRVIPRDYYLPRDEVNKWSKEGVPDVMKSFDVEAEEEEDDDSGCADHWQNMKEEVTARLYGMYDETGFFHTLCRYGFVLKVVDMVSSGELSKYPLSLTAHILNILGEVALAYDIGCKYKKLVKVHPLLKELAADKNFRALVGTFHGHGHGHLCGLENLMTYVEGVGLRDIFLKVQRPCLHHPLRKPVSSPASHYHVPEACGHLRNVTRPIKYRRTLEVKATYGTLRTAMQELGVESRDVFETWHAKEKAHLLMLSKEASEETLEMEYYQKLVNLMDAELVPFISTEADDGYAEAAKATCRIETQQCHALELQARALTAVQELEVRLAVDTRWTPDGEKWATASKMVTKRQCLSSQSEICREQHIAKSLQVCSKAVKAAIVRYNEVAEAMTLPKPTLDWEDIVEYAFLADFDLLREGREDI